MLLGYARVSTDDQETHLQIDALKAADCERIYQEKASGAEVDRPELMRLLDQARTHDVVVVWKLDRLGRSLLHLIETVNLLRMKDVQSRSLTENIITPSGKLVFGVFAPMSKFERDMLQQRTRAGLAAARKRGRIGGRLKSINVVRLKKTRAMPNSDEYKRSEVATGTRSLTPYIVAGFEPRGSVTFLNRVATSRLTISGCSYICQAEKSREFQWRDG
jgi:DNA invertase Pin-like site-specific DNA recombinase